MDFFNFFSKLSLKRSVIFLAKFLRQPHVQKKSGSRDIMEKLSTNHIFQIAISFEPFDGFL